MAKTKVPHSIRPDEKDFDFICKREGLKTAQSVFDFLLREYMKIYRVEKPSVFSVATKESFDGSQQQINKLDEAFQWQEEPKGNYFAPQQEIKKRVLVRSYEQYDLMKRNCADAEEWAEIADEIRNSDLPSKQKASLLKPF